MRVEYFAQMAIGDVKPKGSTEILLASLAEEGLKPEDIDTVIYTHLHNDHAGNADLFPDAVTYVQKAEYDNMLSPYPFPKARMDYFPDTPERLSKVKRLLLVDGDLKLANGLELYLTPGHSRGGQTIVVPTEKGRYVITGDNSATKYCLFADMDKMTLMDGTVINITPDHTIPHLTGRFTTDRFAFYDSARKQLALAEKTGADIVYCSYALIDEAGEKNGAPFVVRETTDFEKMLVCNTLSCSTVFIKREAMRPFDTRFYHEDYALWLELLRDGCRAVGTAEVLADYRILPGSRSNNKWKSARHRWEIYRDLLGLSPVKRSALMLRYTLSGLRKYADTRL